MKKFLLKKFLLILFIVGLIACLLVGCNVTTPSEGEGEGEGEGEEEVTRVVLVELFTSHCTQCKIVEPLLEEVAEEYSVEMTDINGIYQIASREQPPILFLMAQIKESGKSHLRIHLRAKLI